ncbi:MAG: SURF1 family cytochrome oxidase biogenesis protein [Microbacterium sp.]
MTSPPPTPRRPRRFLPEDFPPTLREVMLRPWWIGTLLFALVVAAVFAWLGQWQFGRAIDTNPLLGATEQVQPIAAVTAPGEYLPEPLVGQRVAVAGTFVAGDFLVVSSRFNVTARRGYWVTGQLRVDPASAGNRADVARRRDRLGSDPRGGGMPRHLPSTPPPPAPPPPPPPRSAPWSSPAASSPTKVPCGPARDSPRPRCPDASGRVPRLVARHRRTERLPCLVADGTDFVGWGSSRSTCPRRPRA